MSSKPGNAPSNHSLEEEAAPRQRQAGTRRRSRPEPPQAEELGVEVKRSKSRKSGRSSKSSASSLPSWEVNHPYFHIDYKYVKKKKASE